MAVSARVSVGMLSSAALLLLLTATSWRGVAADDARAVDGEVQSAVRDSMSAVGADESTVSMLSIASCLTEKEAVRCLERRAIRYRDQLESEKRSFESRALQVPEQDAALRDAEELLDDVLPVDKDDKDATGADSNSRGHKLKKKIHKIIKIIKIILFIVIVKLKMVFMMFMMQTLFQFKLVAITFMILLIKKYYLWVEWKHKKEEKKAVVYYEHAQHQHHYDETDHFHDGLGGLLGHGHHDYHKGGVEPSAGAEAGGWGGWWGKRSAEYPAPIVQSNNNNINNNPALVAQQMAYGAQLQGQPSLTG